MYYDRRNMFNVVVLCGNKIKENEPIRQTIGLTMGALLP